MYSHRKYLSSFSILSTQEAQAEEEQKFMANWAVYVVTSN